MVLAAVLALAPAVRDLHRALARPRPGSCRTGPPLPAVPRRKIPQPDPHPHAGAGTTLASTRAWATGRRRRRPRPGPRHPPPTTEKLTPHGLHITWYGHSTALVEIEGARILTDPVFSDRCSPAPLPGPRRLHPSPLPAAELPPLDAVVISHDHYDHPTPPPCAHSPACRTHRSWCRSASARTFNAGTSPRPHHRTRLGQSVTVNGVRLTATEARHYSGRGLTSDKTLWASWVLTGERRRVFYSGDSGYFPGYAGIGSAHGPFDVTLMQIGAYGDAWADIHMTPEQALTAHTRRPRQPPHPPALGHLRPRPAPLGRARRPHLARRPDHRHPTGRPQPGQRVDAAAPPEVDGWWQRLA